jgi:hypothetical protein
VTGASCNRRRSPAAPAPSPARGPPATAAVRSNRTNIDHAGTQRLETHEHLRSQLTDRATAALILRSTALLVPRRIVDRQPPAVRPITARPCRAAGRGSGGALALAQSSRKADLSSLREQWTEQGRMDTLLRAPFEGHPTSLLRGDCFQEQLRNAMAQLTTGYEHSGRPWISRSQRRCSPAPRTSPWMRSGSVCGTSATTGASTSVRTPSGGQVDATVVALALAVRSSASYPVALMRRSCRPAPARRRALHPTSWADWCTDPQAPRGDKSRFTVDGGVLANTPTVPRSTPSTGCGPTS